MEASIGLAPTPRTAHHRSLVDELFLRISERREARLNLIKNWSRLAPRERTRMALAAILATAFLIRLIYRARLGEADFFTNGYTFFYEYAKNIAAGKGLWLAGNGYAMRPPAYPYFLSLGALLGGN